MFNYNWVNFYPLRLGIEAGKYKGRYVEVECVVLGVGFVFELYEVDSREHWGDDMDKLMEKHKASDTFFVLDDCGECHGTGSVFREETK